MYRKFKNWILGKKRKRLMNAPMFKLARIFTKRTIRLLSSETYDEYIRIRGLGLPAWKARMLCMIAVEAQVLRHPGTRE